MGVVYAEVIGDPVAQSKSPVIHNHWLSRLGLEGEFRAVRVRREELPDYLADRRADPDWRGCSVTMPHKQAILPLLDHVEADALAIGAVNCVHPGPHGLTGRNSDVEGVGAALASTELAGHKATVIGAGGAARAAIRHLLDRDVRLIALLVRDPVKAATLRENCAGTRIEIWPLGRCDGAMAGARAIVNASPMGMEGAAGMPAGLLACIAAHAPRATLFDMVYKPLETRFLETGRANGGIAVDGLAMLVGQARSQFETFFGHSPPDDDGALRALLAG